MRSERTLLVLDGMEPLQLPPGPNEGCVNNHPALQALLCGLAANNPGLCVITTRLKVAELERFPHTTRRIDLEALPPEAGAQLLRSLGVKGLTRDLLQASQHFGNHALALTLLGTYLSRACGGNIRKSKEIKLTKAAAAVVGDHARNMMRWYEKWFVQNGRHAEVAILRILGLFNRPAEDGCIKALREEPPIAELTQGIIDLSEHDWSLALHNLRVAGLVSREDPQHSDGKLDCHPLVREHFGEELRRQHPEAWKAGHRRLFEHLRGPGCETEYPETLEEMQPLYAAVTHGCAAGQLQDALDDVYGRRIIRRREFFSTKKLGAFGADLGALANFFVDPWRSPLAELSPDDRMSVLGIAGFNLRAVGRLSDAVVALEAGLKLSDRSDDPDKLALRASNLSEVLLTLGELELATRYATESVSFADRSEKAFERVYTRTTLAEAYHAAGRAEDAEGLCKEAEAIQVSARPQDPLLYSVQGYRYCELLLDQGMYQDVPRRAARAMEIASRKNQPLAIGLSQISLSRAHLLRHHRQCADALKRAAEHVELGVDQLRKAGQFQELPRGLLVRAELHILFRNLDAARADLNEAFDISVRDPQGHMKLFITDYHLLSARLALAQAEIAQDRTQDRADGNLQSRHETRSDRLRASASVHAEKAAVLIDETGYHRRDGDLAELRKNNNVGFRIS